MRLRGASIAELERVYRADFPRFVRVATAVAGDEQAASPTQRAVGFVDDLFSDRLRLLYLAFTLAALALCLAPRLTLPARLPARLPGERQ